MRPSQLKGRLRLRRLLEVTEAAGEVMEDHRPRFERLAREDAAPRVVSAVNLFQTPVDLAARAAGLLAEGRELGRTLEPSAGLGRLYRAIRDIGASPIVLVEVAADCCRELYRETQGDTAATLRQGDFMHVDDLGSFDSVLMNPPFNRGEDIKHITRAATMLGDGGRLVAICANGPRQRAKLMPLASYWEDLPAGSFASEGTNVNAALLVINKETQ